MARYNFKARKTSGNIVQGQMNAADENELRQKLNKRGCFLIEFSKKPVTGSFFTSLFASRSRVSPLELSVMCWQLYTMLDAGVTLLRSLRLIVNNTKNKHLKRVVSAVVHRIEDGASLSSAVSNHPRVFSRLFVQMVNAGEVGGVLDQMLMKLAQFYEREADIQSRLKAATMYPVLLLMISVSTIVFIVLFVLPRFASVFEDLGASLPLMTEVLLKISHIVARFWYVVIFAPFVAFVAFKVWLKTTAGRYRFDLMKLNCPVVGDLIKKAAVARVSQTLSILVGGGIPILVSLDVATDVVGNTAIEKTMKDVCLEVSSGKPIAQPLAKGGVFPDMVVNMVEVGEETGSLDVMLAKVADFYEREVDNAIKIFTKLLEPILIVIMAVVIGFVAISMFLPMADLMSKLKH